MHAPRQSDGLRSPSHSHAHSTYRSRPGRAVVPDGVIGFLSLCAILAVLFCTLVWIGRWPDDIPPVNRDVLIVAPDLCAAPQIARHYGYPGDWRRYEAEMERLNGWRRWPVMHVGDRVWAPDYRRARETR